MNKIKQVGVFLHNEKIGRMALTPDELCAFEYEPQFLSSGFSISPFFLPLKKELFIAKRHPFRGGFGVFDDSLPDGWGSLVLDRYLRSKGIDPYRLSLLQRLALVGSTGRGALEFRPDWSEGVPDEIIDFDLLAQEAEKVLTTEYSGDLLETFYRFSGSSGGARPKVFVRIEDKEWLVKFKTTHDPDDMGKTEYKYSLLAKRCGIKMPETRLFEGRYFATERFDRTEQGKIHTVSAAGLLHADYREPSLDYEGLLKLCHILTKNMAEVYALFRQMVFNVFIKNRDDHAKNFSFQHINGEWKLSPAYDLLPSRGFNGFHTTTINGSGDPSKGDILKVAEKTNLNAKKAEAILGEVEDIVGSKRV